MFERRMPPCGKGGLWAHWGADALLRDFHSDMRVLVDGSVLTIHLAVYPGTAVARRWMHQFANHSFGCTFVRTPDGDRSVQRTDTFGLARYRVAPRSVGVHQGAGMGQEYRLFNGQRGSVASVAFRASNAVVLVNHWRHDVALPLGADTFSHVERLGLPIVEQLVRHYG